MGKGLVHVYYGDGKGKTTAAMGLAVRAAGGGNRVLIVQFLKGRSSCEVGVLQSIPGITLMRGKEILKFSWDMTEEEKQKTQRFNEHMIKLAMEQAEKGGCDMLVLDEALGACATGLLHEEALLAFLREKPEALEVVLTGRDPSAQLLNIADYATEMCKRKHPFDQGIPARKGVEF